MPISNLLNIRGLSLACTLLCTVLTTPVTSVYSEPLDHIVAVVNDDIILDSELQQRMAIVKSQLAARQQRLPPDTILTTQVLDRLVLDNLILQIAEQQGIKVTDRQLNEAINNIAQRNGMTLEQFRQALLAEGQDYIQAREQIRREMLIAQVQQSNVNRRIHVSEQEVAAFLASDSKAQQGEVLTSIILVSVPNQAAPEQIEQAKQRAQALYHTLQGGADFAEAAIAASSAPNALNGGDLGWRQLSELPDTLTDAIRQMDKGDISPPLRSAEGFYILQLRDLRGGQDKQIIEQTKVRHILLKPSEIRSPAQTKRLIERVYQQIQHGASFAELAKELSDDPGSGSQGGDLDWAEPGQMVPEFEQVMVSTPVGSVSSPFESRFGWHILQVEARRNKDIGAQLQDSQARASIRNRKFAEELNNWLREIRSEAYVEIKS